MRNIQLIITSLLCSVVNAQFGSSVDYTLIIGYPKPAADAPDCTMEETARLERHAREALLAAGEDERGNSQGLLSYNNGQKQDRAALAHALNSAAMTVGEVSLEHIKTCDPDCAYWCKILNVCICCPHACCGNGNDIGGGGGERGFRLRGVAQEDLPGKITKIRSKYMFLTAADMSIRCVDAMEAIVTVSAGYLPSESFNSSWEL